ncbi:MAG: hypothetical protein ACOYN4_06465 [Bacteroidales bacterium]
MQDKEQIKFSFVLFTMMPVFGVKTKRKLRIRGGISDFIFAGTINILFAYQEINQNKKAINELSGIPFRQTLNNGLMDSS